MACSPLVALAVVAAAALASAKVNIPQGTEFGATFLKTNIYYGSSDVGFHAPNGSDVPVDASGWPLSDCSSVMFDMRAVPAWAPPLDDPWGWSPPVNGTYWFNLTGKATVTEEPGSYGVVSGVTFDEATWTTAGFITMPLATPATQTNLMVLVFTNTQRSAAAPPGSGFTGLRVMRPGHYNDTEDTWSPELLQALEPFRHIRFMGITGTNNQAGYYGDVGHHILEWGDRCLKTDAFWCVLLRY